MTRCAVYSCKNNSSVKNVKNSGISYHRFPVEPSLKRKWVAATGRPHSWIPTKSSSICSLHFEDDCFKDEKKRKSIYKDAIPTLQLCNHCHHVHNSGNLSAEGSYISPADISLIRSKDKNEISIGKRGLLNFVKQKDKKIKSVQEQNRRLKKKMESMNALLKQLQVQSSHSQRNADLSLVTGGESPVSGGESNDDEEESSASGGDEEGSWRGGVGACATCGGAVGTLGRRARGCPAKQFVQAAIFPRELNEKTLLCEECYIRYCNKEKQIGQKNRGKSSLAKGASKRVVLSEETENVDVSTPSTASAPQPSVILQNYKRASSRSEGCLFPFCIKRNLQDIPQHVKQRLLREYKLYTPEGCQVCGKHLFSNNWKSLLEKAHSNFTAQQIEDVISTLTTHLSAFNVDNIEDIPPNLLLYCTGFSHGQLQRILDMLPSFRRKTETPVLALTACLTKLRTDDSFDRLSTLFQTTTSRLEKLISVAKYCMLEEFIPLSTDKSKRELESNLNTSDDTVLSFLQEQFCEYGGTIKDGATIDSRLETPAASKLSQSRKRENSSDSDDDSLASKKRLIEMKVETMDSIDEECEQQTVVKLEVEFGSPERSESSNDEPSGQQLFEEVPSNEERIIVYASKPTKDFLKDPLDTVPTTILLEAKSEEETVTFKEEPEEWDLEEHQTAQTQTILSSEKLRIEHDNGCEDEDKTLNNFI